MSNKALSAFIKLTREERQALNELAGKNIFAEIKTSSKNPESSFERGLMSEIWFEKFISDYTANDVNGLITNCFYATYCEFCTDNNVLPISNIEFSKRVKTELNVIIINKKIGGKKRRVFVSEWYNDS